MAKKDSYQKDRVLDAYLGKLGTRFMGETQRRINWLCEQARGRMVLDVGCSQGIVPVLLGREGIEVVGIDGLESSIDEAQAFLSGESKETQDKVDFVCGSFNLYDFGDRRFDTVIMGEVLEHLVQPEAFIEKALKLLSPAGRIVVTVPFGINSFPDHKRTYYAVEPMRLLSQKLTIRDIAFVDKWIGLVADTLDEPGPFPSEFVESNFLDQLEEAFYSIESRSLSETDSLKQTIAELESAAAISHEVTRKWQKESLEVSKRLNEATNKLTRLQLELQSTAHLRKANKRLQSELDMLRKQFESIAKQELSQRRREADKVRKTLSFQLGHMLIHKPRSLGGVLALPSDLWNLRGEAERRREARGDSTVEAKSEIVPSPSFMAAVQGAGVFKTPGAISKGTRTSLRVASIMDEFTASSFADEWTLLRFNPDSWEKQLAEFKPDLLFIESAWHGNGSAWSTKVSKFADVLQCVIAWCKKRRIPTVFWNKEDPVHFETFLPVAKAVDFVFTTDIDCVPDYVRLVEHDNVYPLLFACQPRDSNPIETYQREKGFCFAGSYYAKYAERQRNFKAMVGAVQQLGPLDIFDRNFKKNTASFRFPEEYRPMIRGTLPFSKIDYAYKGYSHGLTINTVKQSQGMFARRAFELVASNTITLSNFSRGIRNTLGDLVVSSDDATEIETQARRCFESESARNRHRLLALRSVLSQHTYRHRSDEIIEAIWGAAPEANFPSVAVLAYASDDRAISRIVSAVKRQGDSVSHTIIVTDYDSLDRPVALPNTRILTAEEAKRMSLAQSLGSAKLLVPFSSKDYYGPHYVEDLALATTYCDLQSITKSAHFALSAGDTHLTRDGSQYRPTRSALLRASLFSRDAVLNETLWDFASRIDSDGSTDAQGIAIDEFSYCRDGEAVTAEQRATIDVLSSSISAGLTQTQWGAAATAFQRASVESPGQYVGLSGARTIEAEELCDLLGDDLNSEASWSLENKRLEFSANLPDGEEIVLYLDALFSPEDLSFDTTTRACIVGKSGTLQLCSVLTFFDKNGKELDQVVHHIGSPTDVAMPTETVRVAIGFRLRGAGTASVRRGIFGRVHRSPALLLARSSTLMLAKQYPSYDDLYKYGFVHSRVREYRASGHSLDIVTPRPSGGVEYREFQGIDVTVANLQVLDRTLASGQYNRLLVHALDEKQWNVISKHIANIPTLVWIHGAEAQPWELRKFDFIGISDAESARKKALSDGRMRFWKALFENVPENLKFVFVSEAFAKEVMGSVGATLPPSQYHIIPNTIDTTLFAYHPKPAEQRTKILSIRSFASRKYANDLTVGAIVELSKRPFFDDLEFHIVGDGALFDETVAPLRSMSNVTLERTFMTQQSIAKLHRSYGVLLTPTRMDSQGVSRDEGMASGLVPVTTRVAAVPEFVDEDCGFLAPPEDYVALADAIETLYHDKELFLALSARAAARVRKQCGVEQTTMKERMLIWPEVPA